MISRIIEYSIRNRFLVLLAWLGVAVWGVYAVLHTPVDAIPDLSENQVIVFADWMGRSPQEIEDQVTYPLSVQLQGLAGVKAVRSSSEPNFSMINVIFDDKTDPYFARTRILERLSTVRASLPADVTPQLAPDANALGQIFWYTVEGDGYALDDLRAVQDFTVRYQLSGLPGVAEVASVGGFVREYQVDVDPSKLRLYDVPLSAVYGAIANSNMSVGAKVLVQSNTEYLIRGLGWLQGLKDLENVEVANRAGVPITLKQLAAVQLGPEFRRSALEKDGREVVGGVVMMRYGENPLEVTKAIKAKIREMQPGLPAGVRIVPFYDRTRLIESAIHTVTGTLKEEMVIASIAILLILFGARGRLVQFLVTVVILVASALLALLDARYALFLLLGLAAAFALLFWVARPAFRSLVAALRTAFVVCITLPMAVLVSFLFMYYLGIPSNIMSLCGIAISIGILVDAAVVMVENATHELHRHFEGRPVTGDTTEIVVRACRLVGRPIFFSVLIMLLSFLPVFALGGMEGKLSHPLAFTKSFAMIGVALLAVTMVPALIPVLVKGELSGEEDNWIVRSFIHIYKPMLTWMVDRPAFVWWLLAVILSLGTALLKDPTWSALAVAFGVAVVLLKVPNVLEKVALIASIAVIAFLADTYFPKLGSEFKPDLNEGSLMDMPSASPRIAMAQAVDDVVVRDRVIRSFPEVEQVVGKIGRADTATDPSPLEMVETVINLRPAKEWPHRRLDKADALAQAAVLAGELQRRGAIRSDAVKPGDWARLASPPRAGDAAAAQGHELLHRAADATLAQFDRVAREWVRTRQHDLAEQIADQIAGVSIDEIRRQLSVNRALLREPTKAERAALREVARPYARRLSGLPRQEEVDALVTALRGEMVKAGVADPRDDALSDRPGKIAQAWDFLRRSIGSEVPGFAERLFYAVERQKADLTARRMESLNRELFDFAVPQVNSMLLDALLRESRGGPLDGKAPPTPEQVHKLALDAAPAFGQRLFLWPKTKADIQKELDSELQVPGWGNTWTQPIQNRVNMLATGVRTQIGIKVFGPIAAGTQQKGSGFGVQGSATDNGPRTTDGGAQDASVSAAIRQMQDVSDQIAAKIRTISGASDVVVDQAMGKRYLEIHVDREKLSRYGVNISDVNQAIETAMGGSRITMTVEGRQRFGVRLRYARDYWQDAEAIGNVLVTGTATPAVLTEAASSAGSAGAGSKWGDAAGAGKGLGGAGGGMGGMGSGAAGGMGSSGGGSGGMGGGMGGPAAPTQSAIGNRQSAMSSGTVQIPLKMLADIRVTEGPAMIKSENGRLRNYVTLNVRDRDLLGFVDEARQALKPIEAQLAGTGMSIQWAGDFEHQMRTNQTMALIFPMVIALILFLLYVTFQDMADTLLVLLAVVGALAGALMFQAVFGFNFSVIVWIGYVAAFGMATETGVIMLVYLRDAIDRRGGLANIRSLDDLRTAVIEGAVHRLRPKLLTEGVAIVGLVPMLWATGTGAEIMRPMAAPVLGGLLISDEVIDLMIPVLFYQLRKRRWLKLRRAEEAEAVLEAEVLPDAQPAGAA